MIIAPHVEVAEGSDVATIAGTSISVSSLLAVATGAGPHTDKGSEVRAYFKKCRRILTDEVIDAAFAFARDSWCTPKDVSDLLPTHDLDPCSNPLSPIRAIRKMMLELGDNGLSAAWAGVLFVNGPFSNLLPWAKKLLTDRIAVTAGAFLTNVDNSTQWWSVLTSQFQCLFLFDDRLSFEPYPGIPNTTNNKPQALHGDRRYFELCDPKLFKLGAMYERRRAA